MAIAAIFTLLILIACLSYIISKERKTRKRLEGQLLSIEKSACLCGLSDPNQDADTHAPKSLVWVEKEKVYFGSAYETTDSKPDKLEMLKKTLGCHNCILFDAGEKYAVVAAECFFQH